MKVENHSPMLEWQGKSIYFFLQNVLLHLIVIYDSLSYKYNVLSPKLDLTTRISLLIQLGNSE